MTFHRLHSPSKGGFTLTEILFSLAIGSFVMAGALTSYVFCTRGFRGLSNYGEIQEDGRFALECFARDLRPGLAVSSCASNRLVVLLPAVVNVYGKVTVTNQVTHSKSGSQWYRSDTFSGKTKPLADNVTQLSFRMFDAAGNSTTQTAAAVSVQVSVVLQKRTVSKYQTSEFLSAQLRMRNCQ